MNSVATFKSWKSACWVMLFFWAPLAFAQNNQVVTVTVNDADAYTAYSGEVVTLAVAVSSLQTGGSDLPADFTVVLTVEDDDALVLNCPSVAADTGSTSCDAGLGTVEWDLTSITDADGERILTVDATADLSSEPAATYDVMAEVTTSTNNSSTGDDEDVADVLIADYDLSVVKAYNYTTGAAGDVLEVTLTVSNNGEDYPTVGGSGAIYIYDDLPASLEFVGNLDASASTAGYPVYSGGSTKVEWRLDGLAGGASETLTFDVKINTVIGTEVSNFAKVTAAAPAGMVEVNEDNDEDVATVTLTDAAMQANVVIQALDQWKHPVTGDYHIIAGTFNFGVYRGVPGSYSFSGSSNLWSKVSGGELPGDPLYITTVYVEETASTSDYDPIWVGTWGYNGVYRSNDGGRTFYEVPFPSFDGGPGGFNIVYAMDKDDDGILYASADRGRIFASMDDGANWEFMGTLPGASADTPWSLLAVDDGKVFAGTFGRGMYVSENYGVSWSAMDNDGLASGYMFDLEFDPNVAGRIWAATASGVYYTDDEGDNWTAFNDGLAGGAGLEARNIYVQDIGGGDNLILVATWGFGVFSFTQGVDSEWQGFDTALGAQVTSFVYDDATHILTLATQNQGVITVDLSSSVSTDIATLDAELPGDYALDQNYPNPFNPETTIRFALPESAPVRLAVYDMLGREVALLIDETLAAGAREVTFDAGNLPSGMYLYRLVSPGQTITRKMVLMK